MKSEMTVEEILTLLDAEFPQARQLGWVLDSVGDGGAVLRLTLQDRHLRPGPSVAGPTLMSLVDTAMYFALLGAMGPTLRAVTTNLNINFMRGVGAGELLVEAKLLKAGKRLAVGEVSIRANGEPDLIAHATVTYSMPPRG